MAKNDLGRAAWDATLAAHESGSESFGFRQLLAKTPAFIYHLTLANRNTSPAPLVDRAGLPLMRYRPGQMRATCRHLKGIPKPAHQLFIQLHHAVTRHHSGDPPPAGRRAHAGHRWPDSRRPYPRVVLDVT